MEGEELEGEDFDEIWTFVERKLKVNVPIYFKNVLKVCGFNNGITIASIVEEDIAYFEGEVKNGNVKGCFKDDVNVLEGSLRSQENFQFTRGHRKFLLFIAATLKEHIRENGQDSCIVKVVSKKNIKATKNKPVKRLCLPPKKKIISNVNSFVESAIAIQEVSGGIATDETIKEHKRIILNKIVNSLIKHTEDMFNENIDAIKKQMSSNLLQIEEKQSENDNEKESDEDSEEGKETEEKCVKTSNETDTASKYTAFVKCPFGCIKPTTLFHIPTILNFFLWNTSNFDRHLKKLHKSESISRKDSIIDVTTTKAESESNAIINTDNLSIAIYPCTSEIQEKLEEVKPQIQQSLLSESVIQDVQEKTLENVEKIQPSFLSESGNVEKKIKKRKKNRQSLLGDSVKEDVEQKTLVKAQDQDVEKVEKLESVRPEIHQSLLNESVIQDVEEKTIGKVEKIQSSLLIESVKQCNAEKRVKKRKKNARSLMDDIVKEDVEQKTFVQAQPRIQQKLLSESAIQDVEEKTIVKVENIQPSLLSESVKQGSVEKKVKKRKKNRQSFLVESVKEGVEVKIQEKRQKIQPSLMSDGVKDEVYEWVKKKKLERRKKKQLAKGKLLSESVEPGVKPGVKPGIHQKKLEQGWRKYV